MKAVVLILFIWGLSLTGYTQEKTVVVCDTSFNELAGLDFSNLEGWVFSSDCGKDLSSPELDTHGWELLKPSLLSTDHINDSGRACGWFRIRMKIDSTFVTGPIGLMNRSWMATDLYIDGVHVKSFGSTGYRNAVFEDNRSQTVVPLSYNFQPGQTYLIAIRVVDQRPYTPAELASPKLFTKWRRVLYFTNARFIPESVDYNIRASFHSGLTISVTAILSLLFWIIFILNRSEKNVQRFATGCTILALLSVCLFIRDSEAIGYGVHLMTHYLALFCVIVFVCYIPIILAGVFNRKMSVPLVIALGVALVGLSCMIYYGQPMLVLAIATVPIGIAFYYLVSSVKRLSRAQLCVVIGFSISVVFIVVFLVMSRINNEFLEVYSLIYTIASPIGMLGYVAFRFKEMIAEVQFSADQVIALSEEKRIQAENQQVILEREVEKQTKDLKETLHHLQETQQQLVHSEKMASLGELTAGIAHEIQNPLNFVKNFSEVSVDLLEEMKVELAADHTEDVAFLAEDVAENLKKIIHHGNRADSIVKGMLLHSRSGSGIRESTEVNAMVDEYVRLGYHGLRAKDKTFNAMLKTDYDEALGTLDVVQQDMGRVLLNLMTNAFYATHDKKKREGADYQPTVAVRTSLQEGWVRIEVSDNGDGIPEDIQEKIFQPFFTTKPTGEGTGLGLSMAYDIVKGHAGQLIVKSNSGVGTTFVIMLPRA